MLTNVIFSAYTLQDKLKNRLKIKRSSVLYPPVDIENIKKLSQEKVEEELFKMNKKIFISYGRFSFPKRFDIIIESFKFITDKEALLVLIGDGRLYTKYLEITKQLNLTEKVHFLPYTPNPYKYLSRSFGFLFASNYEGLPLSILEAFALGKPVISTPTPFGPLEVIENGKTGLLSENFSPQSFAATINHLLSDSNLYNKIAENAYKQVLSYEAHIIAQQLANIIYEVI
jgi:glycosyltransferase involved in cell wall biosynthesis